MSGAGPDRRDMAEFRAYLDTRGYNPAHFDVAAAPVDPEEGAFSPSARTVTIRHLPTGKTVNYGVRTWVEDFKSDAASGRLPPRP